MPEPLSGRRPPKVEVYEDDPPVQTPPQPSNSSPVAAAKPYGQTIKPWSDTVPEAFRSYFERPILPSTKLFNPVYYDENARVPVRNYTRLTQSTSPIGRLFNHRVPGGPTSRIQADLGNVLGSNGLEVPFAPVSKAHQNDLDTNWHLKSVTFGPGFVKTPNPAGYKYDDKGLSGGAKTDLGIGATKTPGLSGSSKSFGLTKSNSFLGLGLPLASKLAEDVATPGQGIASARGFGRGYFDKWYPDGEFQGPNEASGRGYRQFYYDPSAKVPTTEFTYMIPDTSVIGQILGTKVPKGIVRRVQRDIGYDVLQGSKTAPFEPVDQKAWQNLKNNYQQGRTTYGPGFVRSSNPAELRLTNETEAGGVKLPSTSGSGGTAKPLGLTKQNGAWSEELSMTWWMKQAADSIASAKSHGNSEYRNDSVLGQPRQIPSVKGRSGVDDARIGESKPVEPGAASSSVKTLPLATESAGAAKGRGPVSTKQTASAGSAFMNDQLINTLTGTAIGTALGGAGAWLSRPGANSKRKMRYPLEIPAWLLGGAALGAAGGHFLGGPVRQLLAKQSSAPSMLLNNLIKKSEDQPPGYRQADALRNPSCGSCKSFQAEGSTCSKFSVKVAENMVCDGFTQRPIKVQPSTYSEWDTKVAQSNNRLTKTEAFKAGFLLRFLEQGKTAAEAETILKTANSGALINALKWLSAPASRVLTGAAGALSSRYLDAVIAGHIGLPVVAGVAGGYGLAKLHNMHDREDAETLKQENVASEYERLADRAEQKSKMKELDMADGIPGDVIQLS